MPTQPSDPIDLASAADMALTQMEQADKQYRDDPEWQAALSALRQSLAAKPVVPKVFVLVIDSDSGLSSSVHLTRAGATLALYTYVAENWGEMDTDDAIPTDQQEAIDDYFARDEGDDRAEVEECEVEG